MVANSSKVDARRALVIVDVQNDFTEGGSLGAVGRDAVANAIGVYVASVRTAYRLVVTTQDWHIDPGEHFVKHVVHCRAGTEGAELDPEMSLGADRPIAELVDYFLRKGQYGEDLSGYLAKDDAGRALPTVLAEHRIEAIDVCGFVENGCVAATIRDAFASGMHVRLLTDLSSATSQEAATEVEVEFAIKGVCVITADEAWK